MKQEVVGAQFRIYSSTAGFVRIDWIDGAVVTGQDAREVVQALSSLAKGRVRPMLIDTRQARSISREARETYAGSTLSSRVALLVESSLSRVLANFYIGMANPRVPTKLFSDLDTARRWLLDEE